MKFALYLRIQNDQFFSNKKNYTNKKIIQKNRLKNDLNRFVVCIIENIANNCYNKMRTIFISIKSKLF